VIGDVLRRLKRRLSGVTIASIPVRARHSEFSVVSSADDEPAPATERLLDVALGAAQRARTVSMARVVARMRQPPFYPDVWPGEHYKLLAGLMLELRPKVVVEIGTAIGLSAVAMREYMPPDAVLHTFDIIAWRQFADTAFRDEDFSDGRLKQVIGDLADPSVFRAQSDLLRSADFIFIDGPKDGRFEPRVIALLDALELPRQPIVAFDDIRVWNMLATWRTIGRPKLDVTSFGHWSGTGLVDWTGALPARH
jgi:predicted O-methyltransferase YrrM